MNERKDCEGDKITWIFLSIIFILLCLLGFPNGCSKVEAADSPTRPTNGSKSKMEHGYMTTHKHDGHYWVVATVPHSHGISVSFQHHPDCSCGKGGK